jgi:predicted nucleic acid-binding protein
MHSFVAGELACSNLRNRTAVLSDLRMLPGASVASHPEVLHLIENHRLWGRGLGWVDAHLLASAMVSNCAFWTLDKRLALAGKKLGLHQADRKPAG